MITGDDRDELSQLFSFDHIENPGKKRFDIYDFDLRKSNDYLPFNPTAMSGASTTYYSFIMYPF